MEQKDYWILVYDKLENLLFSIRDDGVIEYGKDYTPEKAKEAFKNHMEGIWKNKSLTPKS